MEMTAIGNFHQVHDATRSEDGIRKVRGRFWATDISYIPMARGFVYLTAVMDWFTRRILAWRLSNTMEASFCIDAVEEALAKHGCPQIFNTDQGSQFTSTEFTSVLINNAISISMDGKGAWRDNVFVERFWSNPQVRGSLSACL